ncbi:hypothetical protein C8F01DRAFT_1284577 [Mycena amicta]|nr:hypothetical protein C8F01DRAFT_1284577 [Mycena amicta]
MQRSTRSTTKAVSNGGGSNATTGLDALAQAAVTASSLSQPNKKAKDVPKNVLDQSHPTLSAMDEDLDELDVEFAKLTSSDHEGDGYDAESDSADESLEQARKRSPIKIRIPALKQKMASFFRLQSSPETKKQSPERPSTPPTGFRSKLPSLATLFSPAKKSHKCREQPEDDSDSDLPLDLREPVKKRRTKAHSTADDDLPGPDAKFPGQKLPSDVPNQLLLASALRGPAEPDFWGPDARKGEPYDIRGVGGDGGGYEGGSFDWEAAGASGNESDIEIVEQPAEPVKPKRGRPRKQPAAKVDDEVDKGKEKEYCATVYVVLQWPEKVPGKKKNAPAQTVIQNGDPIGPTTITTNDPADIDGLTSLLAVTVGVPASTIRIASLTYKFLKNGRPVGTPLPLKDSNGLAQLQRQIKSANLALKGGDTFYFEIHMARPQLAIMGLGPDADNNLNDSDSGFTNSLQIAPVNDISKLIAGKKTLDEKLAPLRTHMFQLYNPGGSLHCGDPTHTEPCARDTNTGLHFILGKNQQDVLVSSVLHEGNEWGVLPIGKSAFRPDKSRDFAKKSHAAISAVTAAPVATPVAPPTEAMGMTPTMVQLMMQQQQQQQMMMQTFMSFMSAPRTPFAFGGMNNAMMTPSPAATPWMFANTPTGPSSFPNATAGPSSFPNAAAGPSNVPDTTDLAAAAAMGMPFFPPP